MTKPRVFVVQQPATFDRGAGQFRPKYDLSPAEEFGKLTFILGPGNVFLDRLPAYVLHMQNTLADFKESDYLLAVGDPVAIAAAAYIAGTRTGGKLNMLKWDRISASYTCFPIITH